jgi:hypothetical protein
MQYSTHQPSQFICTHLTGLLPAWSHPVASVLIVIQPCDGGLLHKTPQTEAQKHHLRQQFLEFGYQVATRLQHMGYLAEVFDPRTGLPLLSQPGRLTLDDVAIASSCLGYETTHSCGCDLILHPTWGSSVYPSTLLSSAQPDVVEWVSREVRLGRGQSCVSVCQSATSPAQVLPD